MSEIVTPEQVKSKGSNVTGLDDSGYDGLGSASKNFGTTSENAFNAEGVKRLLESCSTSREDQLWITAANYLMVLVMGASVVYLLTMGEKGNDTKLGGKRAAIQHCYNRFYGIADAN